MLDADLTYDAGELPRFVEELEDGGDMVLGDRMQGIQPGAMPWLHRTSATRCSRACSTGSSAPR